MTRETKMALPLGVSNCVYYPATEPTHTSQQSIDLQAILLVHLTRRDQQAGIANG